VNIHIDIECLLFSIYFKAPPFSFQTIGIELWGAEIELWVAEIELWVAEIELWGAEIGLWGAEIELWGTEISFSPPIRSDTT
jgi:hypothetical protein